MQRHMRLLCRGREILFPRRPLVMGIVNLNDDSFCHDGTLNICHAFDHTKRLAHQGADIIDVGGESARTNRLPISAEEEVSRVRPFIEAFEKEIASASPKDEEQIWPPLLSINTWRAEAARPLLECGGDILNDMGGLPDDRNARLCAETGAALLIMHTLAPPKVPMTDARYGDVVAAVEDFFLEKISMAQAAGLPFEQIVMDPGFDFAKQKEDNLRLLGATRRLVGLGRPLLLPLSRKTFIGDVLGLADPRDRDAGTIACIAAGIRDGAAIFRVHNVLAAFQAVKICHAVLRASTSDSSLPLL